MPIVDGVEVEEGAVVQQEGAVTEPVVTDTQESSANVSADAAAGTSTEENAPPEAQAVPEVGEELAVAGEEDDAGEDQEQDDEEELDEDEQMSANAVSDAAAVALAAMFKALASYASTNGIGFVDLNDAETLHFVEQVSAALEAYRAATMQQAEVQRSETSSAAPVDNAAEDAVSVSSDKTDPDADNKETPAESIASSVVFGDFSEQANSPAKGEDTAPKAESEDVVPDEAAVLKASIEEVNAAASQEVNAAASQEETPQTSSEAPQDKQEVDTKPVEETTSDVHLEVKFVGFSPAGNAAASGDLSSAAPLPAPVEEVDQSLLAAAALAAQAQPAPSSPKGPSM